MKTFVPKVNGSSRPKFAPARPTARRFAALALVVAICGGLALLPSRFAPAPAVSANNAYYNFSGGASLNFQITPATANLITTNDVWTNVPSAEGFFGQGLTGTHGVDPQTVLGTEFANNQLPVANTQVNANKGNPSAFNAGGVTEFDNGSYLAIGFQGNVQANPYLVFYLNTTGRSNITFSYDVTDIDGGSNNAVSPIALQYRVGETGNFTNVPAGFVADATDGPNAAGRVTSKSVLLPAACNNQAKVQIRLITTNAANASGNSTPDEWIGVNNVTVSAAAPTAATATAAGRVFAPGGRPLMNAAVTMYGPTGETRTARTNQFGAYFFDNLPVGETYVFEVASKRFVFPQPMQVVNLYEDTNGIDFFADAGVPILFKSFSSRKTE